MDESRLIEIERLIAFRDGLRDTAWVIGDARMTDIEIMAWLASEVRRLRRENHLLSLSRGTPSSSQYAELKRSAEHTGIMGPGLLGVTAGG